jgi:hypothetical protein
VADSAKTPTPDQQAGTGEEPERSESATSGEAPGSRSPSHGAGARKCANCGAELQDGQGWCLHCGAARRGSLESGGPGWRSATTVLAVTGVLVLAAAAAGYAALSKRSPRKPAARVVTIAQAPATVLPSTPAPGVTAPGTSTPPASVQPTPTPIKPLEGKTTLPKIPLTAPTPKPLHTILPKTEAGGTGKSPTKSSSEQEPEPTPILLDTNAASTYNPYGYPGSEFGDPALAIDNEASTAWTARVNPAVAPRMAEGLVIDLKSVQKVGQVALLTSTPGMVVQVYGATGHSLPSSIVDPAWVPLSTPRSAKKGKTQIKLHHASKGFRYVLLWISEAPASAVGTPQAPGHVAVNELELFPPQ